VEFAVRYFVRKYAASAIQGLPASRHALIGTLCTYFVEGVVTRRYFED